MFGNLESMDTKATGIDEDPVQAYKFRSCGKNVITNQEDTRELKALNICQRPKPTKTPKYPAQGIFVANHLI
jgi:hypothetical protein